jgi:hypothetical protein
MLFLLRKIRRKLISNDNKTITYLLYAVGEIILVVVGILIAVQIDNWNEERNNHQKQIKQLYLIKNEMVNNQVLLEKEWDILNLRLAKQLAYIDLMNSKSTIDTISESAFHQLFYDGFNRRVDTHIENSALNELISSGGLKDIKNDTIRNVLASWEARLTALHSQEDNIGETYRFLRHLQMTNSEFSMRQYFVSLFPNHGINPSPIGRSNKSILDVQEFENLTITIFGQCKGLTDRIYPQYQKDLKEIMDKLDQELNRP